jgi:nucleoside permease NupC
MVATYALCGFSNFGAMATLVSTLKVMAPTKTRDITRNAYWSLLVANVVCDMTACIAGMNSTRIINIFQINQWHLSYFSGALTE